MSRLARAIEILEAINTHFNEGSDCVYRDGLILSDDNTLQDAIADCLGQDETPTVELTEAKHKRKKIAKNYYGNWVGFEGKKKVRDFGKSEEFALQWLWGV